MSVLNASNLFNTQGRVAPTATDERPQSEIWLNVGVMVKVIDPETGDEIEELLRHRSSGYEDRQQDIVEVSEDVRECLDQRG